MLDLLSVRQIERATPEILSADVPFCPNLFFSPDLALWHCRCRADESFANFDPIRCVRGPSARFSSAGRDVCESHTER